MFTDLRRHSVLLFDLYIGGDYPLKFSREVYFMHRTYLRGDMYFADLNQCVGSEQEGNRPVVLIQNDVGNKHSPTVIVAAITSQTPTKAKLPTHCYVDAESGLERPSIILLEQLRTIDKRRLGRYIGRLDKKHIDNMNHALAISIGLITPIPQDLTLCLCGACADNFRSTGVFILRCKDPKQPQKDVCVYCKQSPGADYILTVRTEWRGL